MSSNWSLTIALSNLAQIGSWDLRFDYEWDKSTKEKHIIEIMEIVGDGVPTQYLMAKLAIFKIS